MKIPTSRITPRVLVLLLIAAPVLQAQTSIFDRVRFLTGLDEYSLAIDAIADSDGNAVLAYSQTEEEVGFGGSFASNVVTKIDPHGEVLWSHRVLPHIKGLATDGGGSVYVAGTRLALPVGPLPTDYFERAGIVTEGSGSGYVAKLSARGVLEWTRLIGNGAKVVASAVAVDRDGHYYVTGQYQGLAQIGQSLPPTSSGTWNIFLAKYAPDGQVQWIRVGAGSSPNLNLIAPVVRSGGLKIDESGNVILRQWAGPYFEGATPTGEGPSFAKFDREGNLLWALPTTGSSGLGTASHDGNVFHAFTGSGLNGANFIRLNKYSPRGDLLWTRDSEVISTFFYNTSIDSIAVDSEGNCFVGGRSSHSENFEAGQITFGDATISTLARSDIFVVKYSPAGALRWAIQSEGQDPDYENDSGGAYRISNTRPALVSVDSGGNIVLSGQLEGTVRFGDITVDGPTIEFWSRSTIFAARIIDPDPVPPPPLKVSRKAEALQIRWSAVPTGFVLESADALPAPTWTTVPTGPVVDGDQNVVTVEIGSGAKFFRLRKP